MRHGAICRKAIPLLQIWIVSTVAGNASLPSNNSDLIDVIAEREIQTVPALVHNERAAGSDKPRSQTQDSTAVGPSASPMRRTSTKDVSLVLTAERRSLSDTICHSMYDLGHARTASIGSLSLSLRNRL
jgi:hypothetical protein